MIKFPRVGWRRALASGAPPHDPIPPAEFRARLAELLAELEAQLRARS